MSLIEELGARLYASSAELPLGELIAALDRLRAGSALLSWVRQESSRPLGVPELSGAIEHLEHAARALLVAQDSLSSYLAGIGLTADAARPPDVAWRSALDDPATPPRTDSPRADSPRAAPPPPLGRWWARRVADLTGAPPPDAEPERDPDPAAKRTGITAADLLRRVARRAGAADRDGLRRELTSAPPPVGLGLAAIAPTVLYRLAGDLLGHQPRAEDLPALTRIAREPVRAVLPGLPDEVLNTLLARLCRVPLADRPKPPSDPATPRRPTHDPATPPGPARDPATPPRPTHDPAAPVHPADSAVASGVLVGVLLRRLGRDPDALDPTAPEPLPARDQPAGPTS